VVVKEAVANTKTGYLHVFPDCVCLCVVCLFLMEGYRTLNGGVCLCVFVHLASTCELKPIVERSVLACVVHFFARF